MALQAVLREAAEGYFREQRYPMARDCLARAEEWQQLSRQMKRRPHPFTRRKMQLLLWDSWNVAQKSRKHSYTAKRLAESLRNSARNRYGKRVEDLL